MSAIFHLDTFYALHIFSYRLICESYQSIGVTLSFVQSKNIVALYIKKSTQKCQDKPYKCRGYLDFRGKWVNPLQDILILESLFLLFCETLKIYRKMRKEIIFQKSIKFFYPLYFYSTIFKNALLIMNYSIDIIFIFN